MKSIILSLLLTPMLSGCFFVFIPGALIDKVAGRPAYCVASGAKIGDRFTINSTVYEVIDVKGESPHYCRDQPEGRRFGVDAKPM